MSPAGQESALRCAQPNWADPGKEGSGNANNNYTQGESDIALKIQLAVLKNDLAHKEQEMQEVTSACRMLAKFLGSGYSGDVPTRNEFGSGDIKPGHLSEKWLMLEQQNQKLQRENELLRRAAETGHKSKSSTSLTESGNEKEGSSARIAKEGMTCYNGEVATEKSGVSHSLFEGHEDSGLDEVSEETKAWGRGCPDVGLASLDDVIGPDEPGSPPPAQPAPEPLSPSAGPHPPQEVSGVNEEANRHIERMVPFQSLPAPTVLKTGFELSGSFKGRDYNSIPQGPRALNRLPSNGSSSGSFGSSAYSERPMSSSHGDIPSSFPSGRYREPRSHRRDGRPDSFDSFRQSAGFFRYGIKYSPSEGDSDYMRRIMISNLPNDVLLKHVLAQVKGGTIVDAVLLNTQAITSSMTVTVQFLHESSARSYLEYAKGHPIQFGSCAQTADIKLVDTPSWPLTTGLYPLIISQAQTRCITIPSFPQELSMRALEQHISGRNGPFSLAVISTTLDDTGSVHLEFSSMMEAHFAYEILTNFPLYSTLEPVFSPDPCACSIDKPASILPSTVGTLGQSQDSHKIPLDSFETKEISEESEILYSKSSGATAGQKQASLLLPARPIVIRPDPTFSGVSWADQRCEEETTSEDEGRSEQVRGLASSIYARPPIRFADLQLRKTQARLLMSRDTEKEKISIPAETISTRIDSTVNTKETASGSSKNEDVSEVINHTQPPLSAALDGTSLGSMSKIQDEYEKACTNTPQLNLPESLIDGSPMPPPSSDRDTRDNEMNSLEFLGLNDSILVDLGEGQSQGSEFACLGTEAGTVEAKDTDITI